jgi:FtsP/CotA-like multicopper oxidase with cupredoxin domain
VNHLAGPTSIHWHGIELDSYYDGVIGGGAGNQVTAPIAAGGSFAARFTPNRAGTFIYHTHAADPDQLSGGVYGALIVLDPGETFDPERDKLLVLGTRDQDFTATRITINGMEAPIPMELKRGVKYRLRLIDMAPNLPANFQLGNKDQPVTWHAIAKDGAMLPPRLAITSEAAVHLASGEAYDFEFQPDTPGEIPLRVENAVNKTTLLGKIIVQ